MIKKTIDMLNDTEKLTIISMRTGLDKRGDIAPAENQATAIFPKISDILRC